MRFLGTGDIESSPHVVLPLCVCACLTCWLLLCAWCSLASPGPCAIYFHQLTIGLSQFTCESVTDSHYITDHYPSSDWKCQRNGPLTACLPITVSSSLCLTVWLPTVFSYMLPCWQCFFFFPILIIHVLPAVLHSPLLVWSKRTCTMEMEENCKTNSCGLESFTSVIGSIVADKWHQKPKCCKVGKLGMKKMKVLNWKICKEPNYVISLQGY